MKNIPVDLDLLEALYQQGQLSGEGLAAIAPITWLTEHYPDLINTPEKLMNIIHVTQHQMTCKACIHFSVTHQCCLTRVDESNSYLAMTETSPACQDFERVNLLPFLKTGGNV